jgi:hypothetical protein
MTASSLRQTRRECERVLTAIFGLLIHCGIRNRAISRLVDRSLGAAMAQASALGESAGGEIATFSLVLDSWHRDRRYLTSTGKPRAVPLLGRPPSVESLIRAEGPQFDAVQLAHRIKFLGLITLCGRNRYRPAGDSALISIYGPTVLQYVARCLTSLLQTVEANLRGSPNVPPLLQRSAEVPDLPPECVESFLKFSRFQGSIFLRTINDWLVTRRARLPADRQNRVHAGVHVHAFVAQNMSRGRTSRRSRPKLPLVSATAKSLRG